jgi:23S rRNA (pseudouridine1915-N3)-methyltransferase
VRRIRFIWVGKLRKGCWQDAAELYLGRVRPLVPCEEIVVKDAPAHLPPEAKKAWEGARILERLGPQDYPVALDEAGRTMTSPALARRLTAWTDDPAGAPCFIVGGAFGLSAEVLAACRERLSLSPMTFPHELARVILLEQVYRALAIARGLPYHHA